LPKADDNQNNRTSGAVTATTGTAAAAVINDILKKVQTGRQTREASAEKAVGQPTPPTSYKGALDDEKIGKGKPDKSYQGHGFTKPSVHEPLLKGQHKPGPHKP